MASSINASTTAGLVNTADTSGVLQLQTAGTTAISIDASQAVSFTNAPTVTGGTANGVAYLNGSKVLTTGSALVFDGSNLGVGVTPSAWISTFKAIQVGNGASFQGQTNSVSVVHVSGNAYVDSGGTYRYIGNEAAQRYQQYLGAHSWYTAASGTAGNAITFTQAMTLDASGNLGIGTTSPSQRLHLNIGSATAIYNRIQNSAGDCYLGLDTSGNTNLSADNTGNQLIFKTQATERARITSAGEFMVNTTATPSSTQAGFYVTSTGLLMGVPSGNVNAAWYKPAGAASLDYHRFVVGGNQYGAISWNGTTGTLYTTTSDYRLKENVQPMQNALQIVALLKPVTYSWKDGNTTGQGFIAHELQEVIPDAVSGKKDGTETYKDEDGNEQTRPQYQGIDTSFLVATLTAAIQEMKAIIDTQASTITQLQADVALLKGA